MRDVNTVLDTVKQAHKIGSDYKLAMYLGIGSGNLRNYRHGRSLPDPKACAKLAAALGEKPDKLIVEMQAQREKDPEARQLWVNLSQRLQAGVAGVRMMAVLAIVSIAAGALPAWAALYSASVVAVQSVYYVKCFAHFMITRMARFVKLCKGVADVPRNPHPAAVHAA
jgi:transcriptional regulator with XRE-family HTH domain